MCFKFYCNSLERTLFYSNMTVPLCIRQGSKINDDSVSVEEFDWSAESQEKGPFQTVAIKLEAHKSLEYHYMLKH